MSRPDDKRVVVAIHLCADEAEATVITALLRDRGIECFQRSWLPNSVFPMATGGVTLYVDESAAENAIGLLEDAQGAS